MDRAWLQVGAIHQAAGQFAEVVAAMLALERAAPDSALKHEAWLRRAQALHRLRRSAEAEVLLKKLTGLPAEALGVQAALELATIELEQNHPADALATLEAAAKNSPQSRLDVRVAIPLCRGPAETEGAWPRPRNCSSRSSKPTRTMPGPTMPCSAPPRRHSNGAMPRRRGS